MSPEKQRIAIATACGWTKFNSATHKWAILYGQPPNAHSNSWELPHFLNDLNAMHAAEKVLKGGMRSKYDAELTLICSRDYNFIWESTASQRAEAFLRTLGLWEKEVNTTKSASPTSPAIEQADHETAEEKVAWLKILLCTKSCDPVFTDYWLRLARRNLRLGLPLTTPEPELNPATEESSATSCGQNPLHPRENCSWWQIGRCPTDCVHSATRLDL